MMLSQYGATLRAVAFGGGEWADDLAAVDGPLDVAFRPVINDFRGRRSVELHFVDWRPLAEKQHHMQQQHDANRKNLSVKMRLMVCPPIPVRYLRMVKNVHGWPQRSHGSRTATDWPGENSPLKQTQCGGLG